MVLHISFVLGQSEAWHCVLKFGAGTGGIIIIIYPPFSLDWIVWASRSKYPCFCLSLGGAVVDFGLAFLGLE
jgi:hypothetical protein